MVRKVDTSALNNPDNFTDWGEYFLNQARQRKAQDQVLDIQRQNAQMAQQKFDLERQQFEAERADAASGRFTGNSIDAQMGNRLLKDPNDPIARAHFSRVVTLPGGGAAIVDPNALSGLGGGTPQPQRPNAPSGRSLANDIQGALENQPTGMTGDTPANATVPDPMPPSGFTMLREPNGQETDVETTTPEQNRAAAEQMGVPYVPLNTRGLTGNQRAMLIRRAAEDARKQLTSDDMTQARNRATANIQDANRWQELQKVQDTGGVQSYPVMRWLSNRFDPEFSEMEAITARLTPQQRVPGSGATSDFDAKMFQMATMGVDKPEASNKNIAEAMKLAGQRELEYQDFLSRYSEVNGTLDGAQQRWKEYSDANPIFDPNKPNEIALNPNRKTFRDYFGSVRSMASAPANVQTSAPNIQPGIMQDGYVFKGGDPADPESWEKVQ